MSTRTISRLTECETMLDTIARRYALARRRLAEVEPGFPPNTPGAGEPGGGTGFTNSSITARLADRRHTELDKARYIDTAPTAIADIVTTISHPLALPKPAPSNSPRHRLDLLVWSRWATRRLLEHPDIIRDRDLERLHTAVVNLHRVVTTWGSPATTPTKPTDNLDALPEDLTGDLCRSCLRVGSRSIRYRGDLCRWCYEFVTPAFIPPINIMEARRDGKMITEQMVVAALKEHREKQKPKTKRRRSR